MAVDAGPSVGVSQEEWDVRWLEHVGLNSREQTARLLSALPPGPRPRLPATHRSQKSGFACKIHPPPPQFKSWFIIFKKNLIWANR